MSALRLLLGIDAVPHRTRPRWCVLCAKCRIQRADCRQTNDCHSRYFDLHATSPEAKQGRHHKFILMSSMPTPRTRPKGNRACVRGHSECWCHPPLPHRWTALLSGGKGERNVLARVVPAADSNNDVLLSLPHVRHG